MPSAGFENTIPAMRWLQTYTLDRTGPGIGLSVLRTLILLTRVINCAKTRIWNETLVTFEGLVYHTPEGGMNTTEKNASIVGTRSEFETDILLNKVLNITAEL
jgi:hypothetical protein